MPTAPPPIALIDGNNFYISCERASPIPQAAKAGRPPRGLGKPVVTPTAAEAELDTAMRAGRIAPLPARRRG